MPIINAVFGFYAKVCVYLPAGRQVYVVVKSLRFRFGQKIAKSKIMQELKLHSFGQNDHLESLRENTIP